MPRKFMDSKQQSEKLELCIKQWKHQVPLSPADIIVPPVQVMKEEKDIYVRVRSSTTYVNDFVVASDRYGVEDKTVIVEDCAV
ncbi:hypothetical protein SADUNF_Sadunf16G0105500 [Salix dunnii]|uniref:Uncharacterized protein n=1 Tax=Salix dunnii TaxID=1413687 RepID=A0A835JAY2_9ROSI|nr:hypothetical protein SADUNF_Sadunf16G0105500 [Salix dunnii]